MEKISFEKCLQPVITIQPVATPQRSYLSCSPATASKAPSPINKCYRKDPCASAMSKCEYSVREEGQRSQAKPYLFNPHSRTRFQPGRTPCTICELDWILVELLLNPSSDGDSDSEFLKVIPKRRFRRRKTHVGEHLSEATNQRHHSRYPSCLAARSISGGIK